jgi:hypothetical protein
VVFLIIFFFVLSFVNLTIITLSLT